MKEGILGLVIVLIFIGALFLGIDAVVNSPKAQCSKAYEDCIVWRKNCGDNHLKFCRDALKECITVLEDIQ